LDDAETKSAKLKLIFQDMVNKRYIVPFHSTQSERTSADDESGGNNALAQLLNASSTEDVKGKANAFSNQTNGKLTIGNKKRKSPSDNSSQEVQRVGCNNCPGCVFTQR
jgi:hypothetical protein